MLRNLLSTTSARLIIAVINLSVVWISARFMGAEILGTISLIILGISIIQLFTAILAGSSLVYQVSRHPVAELLTIAWLWIIIVSPVIWFLLSVFSLIPAGFKVDVLILSVIGGIVTVNQNVFLGREKVNLFNVMAVIQSLIVLLSLVILVVYKKWLSTDAYVTAQYISLGLTALTGTLMNIPSLKDFSMPRTLIIREAFRFGGFLQAASIMQLFNYRLSYYLIEKFFDRATLGIFSLGVQISESVWIISKSMAVLLYSKLSNNRNDEYAIRLTLNFIKATTTVTILILILIFMLPEGFFIFIFRSEFRELTTVILSLAPGILAVAISLMYSHYFSGNGKPMHNTVSSGLGLVVTIVLGLTLIPLLGVIGAGITASVSYLVSMLYQAYIFKTYTGVSLKSYLPGKRDIYQVKNELKALLKASG